MENFTRIDYQGQPVLSYKQVAAGLKCSNDLLRHLYRHHKDEFQAGVHFFKLEGSSLRLIKKEMNNLHVHSFAKGAKSLVLWTKQGVARLSKLIDTPEAWELFTALEQSYFDKQKVATPVQQTLPLPAEPVVAVEAKACVYVLGMTNSSTKIGITKDILERARIIERQSGATVERIYNSALMSKDIALAVEKTLHDKFDAHRLEGEFFNVPFAKAVRELERSIAELHLFEPLALPDVNLVDKFLDIAAQIQDATTKDKILTHAANLLVGHQHF